MRPTRETWGQAGQGRPVAVAEVTAAAEAARLAGTKLPDLVTVWSDRESTTIARAFLVAMDGQPDLTLRAWARSALPMPWFYDPGRGIDRQRYPWDPATLPDYSVPSGKDGEE